MTEDEKVLLGMLLWVRNHYDFPHPPKNIKERVIKVTDLVINNYGPTIECATKAREFRAKLEEKT